MTPAQRVMLVLFVSAVFALYWPALETLSALWRDTEATTYTHGWLIAALSLWLLWRPLVETDSAAAASDSPRQRGFLAVALLVLVMGWQLSYHAGIQVGYLLLLPPLAWCAVRFALGDVAARRAAFPLLFFYFAMPPWDYLTPYAHAGTVHAVRLMLRSVGVPAFFSGDTVQIPSGTFAIEDGCSGLHFIIVALAVAALIGELRYDGWRMRLRWLLIALLLAVVTNWIRVFSIILLGHFTHMQHYVVRVSHYRYGWGLFLVAMFALFLYERRVPLRARSERTRPASQLTWRYGVVSVAAGILALPALMNPIIRRHAVTDLEAVASPPRLPSTWRAQAPDGAWSPVQADADIERRWRFTNGSDDVEVFMALYREQRQRKKLGGYANRPAGDAEVLENQLVTTQGRTYAMQRIEQQGSQSLLWLRYQVAERSFASAIRAQLWYSLVTLSTLSSPPSSVWAIRAPCRPDCSMANSMLEHAVQEGGGTL